MSLVSLTFIGFCLVLTVIYYVVPGRLQNVCLLAADILFLLPLTNAPIAIGFLFTSLLTVYAAGRILEHLPSGTDGKASAGRRAVLILTILLNLGFLFAFKYLPSAQNLLSALQIPAVLPDLTSLAPLGISFYTLQLIGYLMGVYDGGAAAEHNFIRFAVFGSYFPQLTSGPISRYENLGAALGSRRSWNYEQVTFGFQRMLWGFFKKIVISERAAVPANTVFNNYGVYNGLYIPVGAAMFAVQLYCDFSGCMDIVIGMSEVLGLPLADNFNAPFFSRSLSEFWRRWHITLGTWCKDYIFYPVQKSRLFIRMRGICVKHFGRKRGKKIPMYLAMAIMWFAVGFWHGGAAKYIIGSGLLHFCYILIEQEGAPLWSRINTILHVNTESGGHIAFQRIRTFLLVCTGFIFFRSETLTDALGMFRCLTEWNPSVLSMGGILSLGLDIYDLFVLILSLILLAYVESLHQRGSVRKMAADSPLIIRWALYIGLFLVVIVLGQYGSGFDMESFIYANF